MTDFRALCAELLDEIPYESPLTCMVRAALDQPAPPAPIDIDALLSPEGPYERGNGQEDGSQLVSGPHGHEWWAPIYGCDTLDNLLDRIRARILPHLRPPIAGIDVPGGDGDYGGMQELCEAEGVDPRVGVPLLQRAKNAWGYAGVNGTTYRECVACDGTGRALHLRMEVEQ